MKNELKNEQEESVFQFASGKDVEEGRINCIPLQRKAVWRETRPFRPRAGDVIYPVLWLVKGRAIARLTLINLNTANLTGMLL